MVEEVREEKSRGEHEEGTGGYGEGEREENGVK